uniref:DRBM domain-containing protein n=1 Tax=Gossypium raimondii TaxID=29730 RepID=A0A0D2VFA9_GOSRA|nr:hypothetical protein B456_010G255200 [Gossypium raimondii]
MNDTTFLGNMNSYGNQPSSKEEFMSFSIASESPRLVDPRLEGSKRSMGSIAVLKELCMMEGLGVAFQAQPPSSFNPLQNDEVYAQVEVDGQVFGKGTGLTWEEAKMQAAEKALGSLRSMLGQFTHNRQSSLRCEILLFPLPMARCGKTIIAPFDVLICYIIGYLDQFLARYTR